MSENFLTVKDLHVEYRTDLETVQAVNGISFSIKKGETLGIVGETGAGKTSTALALLRLLPELTGYTSGEITLEGKNIADIPDKDMRDIRGKKIAMIFQDPMTALNPVMTVESQIAEAILFHHKDMPKDQVTARVDEVLNLVGIALDRKKDYPHQFSGGMKQRVVIAIALACNPKLLIADEPTTALDVTIQAQVLDLMRKLRDEYKMAMVMITHDLGIVAEVCDEVAVMYAGRIVEKGTLREVFNDTKHPYTEGLFNSLPNPRDRKAELIPIPGLMPDPANLPEGCAFADRCAYATEACRKAQPTMHQFSETHSVLCTAYDDAGFHIRRNHNG